MIANEQQLQYCEDCKFFKKDENNNTYWCTEKNAQIRFYQYACLRMEENLE